MKSPPNMDELYGLEPVLEPADGDEARSESLQARTVQCPYCGESFDTVIDCSSGSSRYIEDCQVCCRPIELAIEVESEDTLVSFEARRSD